MRRSTMLRAVTAYLTDVEGNTHYWRKYLSMSRVVKRCPATQQLVLEGEGSKFVYGGDAFDKGGDDLVFAQDLMQLKRDYPDRVHLIAGNRDVNKMNFASLFTDEAIAALGPPQNVPLPFFMAGHSAHVVSYSEYLQRHKHLYPQDRATKLSYFRWRLDCTMGTLGLFDQRRAFLARQQQGGMAAGAVSDEAVMDSFLASSLPGGTVYEYLQLLQLATIVDGTLFVHGAVTKVNAGFVPNATLREAVATHVDGDNVFERGGTVQEWVAALNRFYADGIAEWSKNPALDPKTGLRGGGALAAYCHMKSTMGKTVVIPSFTNGGDRRFHHGHTGEGQGHKPNGSLGFVDLSIVDHCSHSGIYRICSGHKPVGDVPVTIQQPGLSVHMMDNSYCGRRLGHSDDDRGDAVQELLLDGADGTARIHGRRADGTPFDYDPDHRLIGIPMGTDGWWSNALLPSGQLLLHKTEDDYFSVQYKEVDPSEMETHLEHHPLTSICEGSLFGQRYQRQELKPIKRKVERPVA